MPEQVVMTANQVADYLGVSTQAVYRLSRQGEIPARKVGRVWRYPKPAVDAWLHGSLPVRAGADHRVSQRVAFGTYEGEVLEELSRKELYRTSQPLCWPMA